MKNIYKIKVAAELYFREITPEDRKVGFGEVWDVEKTRHKRIQGKSREKRFLSDFKGWMWGMKVTKRVNTHCCITRFGKFE